MPTGEPVKHDFEAMVDLVIRERKIALPASRLIWYARWFGLNAQPASFRKILYKMVKAGKLVEVKDGRHTYYKLRHH